VEQVNPFTYLGSKFNTNRKINEQVILLQISGNLMNILKSHLVQRQSRLKVCNISAIPSLLCGYETFILKQRDNL